MNGKRVIITGASRGIGKEAAFAIARQGAELTLVVRDKALGESVADECKRRGAASVDVLVCDLSSQKDIRRLAQEILDRYQRINVLINNAGAIYTERSTTVDGLERTFATNHVAYFLLTTLLLERLKASAPARIINVASDAHRRNSFDLADLQSERSFTGMTVYGASKLMNILFTRELHKRLAGSDVTVNALHPGVVATNFGDSAKGLMKTVLKLARPFMRTEADGAKTTVYLASSAEVSGVSGRYFKNCREATPSAQARRDDLAAGLWAATEKLVEASA
jgi:NAD(P)-dependent dehydrogenase (short-subunit alcohol dehydrogenase family)